MTPCKLIRGIITEVGVAEAAPLSENRENTDRVIDIPSFLRSKGMKSRCEGAVEVRTNAPVAFKVMTEAMLADYLSEMPKMRDLLGMTAGKSKSKIYKNKGLFLYTFDFLFHVEWFIRQFRFFLS